MPAWGVLALGQILSVLVTGTGVCSTLLAARGMSFPMFQSTITYFVLSLHLLGGGGVGRLVRTRRGALWKYAIIAVIDLQANYLLVLAYRYTSMASVMLLDCATIPCVMVLSRIFLRASYQPRHFVGVALCVAGLGCAVASDWLCARSRVGHDGLAGTMTSSEVGSVAPSDPLRGDMLTLCGAALYAVSNTFQELQVKRHGERVFLGYVGLFGALLGLLQTTVLEGQLLRATSWQAADVCLVAVFTVCLVSFYKLTSLFLRLADAAHFSLSLLTSDIFAVAYVGLVAQQRMCWEYAVGFAVTLGGVVTFAWGGRSSHLSGADESLLPLSLPSPSSYVSREEALTSTRDDGAQSHPRSLEAGDGRIGSEELGSEAKAPPRRELGSGEAATEWQASAATDNLS
mmetsp:Transcript_33857/g.84370  ORF Transcript_33857/g.84370 Transcript_33857/m.84370 type:complete len:401 (-) Transcript_33857:113-1315(-)